MNTLLAPLASPLPSYLEPCRFWIWLQMVAWRLYVRAVKGRGIPFMTVIDRQGTVYLKWIGHPPHEVPQAPEDPLAFTPSKAFRIALGDLESAHPGESRDMERAADEYSCGIHFTKSGPLPLPDI
tara:strand:- start:678 stop:1052 length:375 start_codon:yes stop_codon:yes gene_type:complete